jgi:hypothetical protein
VNQAGQTDVYDALGRVLKDSGSGHTFNFGYVGATSQVATDGVWDYTYDPLGNLAAEEPAGGLPARGHWPGPTTTPTWWEHSRKSPMC